MKFIIFLFAICCSGYINAMDEEALKKCIEDSDASEEEIEKIMNKDIPETENEKCLMKCIMQEMDLMNDDNLIDMEGAAKFVKLITEDDEEKYDLILAAFEECHEETKDNAGLKINCDASKIIAECLMPKIHE